MASIDARKRKDGSTAYRLRWRYGGRRDSPAQSATYDHPDDARKMKGAIEARGHLVYDTDPAVLDFSLVTGMRQHKYTAPTFGEVAERYISSRTQASAKSRDTYRRTVNARLSDLVRLPIEAITDDDIRRTLNEITDAGMSALAAYELTCSVFKYAMNKAMLPHGNPCAQVDAPKKSGRVGVFLTPAEARLMLDHSATITERLTDVADAILGTGLRISEALGLIVADVHVDDLDSAWLDVDMQLSKPSKTDPELRRVPVKTEAAQRRVVLDPGTATVFTRLVANKRSDAPVFEDPGNGGWWTQSRVNNAWARARKAARADGLPKAPRIHDLRHTHAAWLITDGVPLLAVSRRLGHESISITADIYGHLLPEADDAIRAALSSRRAAVNGGHHAVR